MPKLGGTGRNSIALLGLALFLAMEALWAPAAAQDALVLSGGGSRGIAHVGAVVGLERQGYDPALVVGTSMGAIVGGLYAAGYPADSLWQMVESTDWSDLFQPEARVVGPDRDARWPMLRLGVDAEPLELSRGFIPDWRVNRLLVRLLFDAGARSRGDFDRLARRYRAVAVDMATGREVVLCRGDLALAIRASMAAPAFFSPVLWDERLLADGGIANYLPISVARRLDTLPVVAVDVARPEAEIGSRDPVALAGRALGLMERNALPDSVADVLVVPEIADSFSGARFSAAATPLMNTGLEAALQAPRRAAGPASPRTLPPPPGRFDRLIVEGPDGAMAALVRRAFHGIAPGTYDAAAVLRAVDRLYATGLVAGVWPRVEETVPLTADEAPRAATCGGERAGESPGEAAVEAATDLVVRIDPTPALSLSSALGYDNDRGGRAWAALEKRTALTGAPLEMTLAGSIDGLDRWVSAGVRLHPLFSIPLTWTAAAHYRGVDVRLFDDDARTGQREVHRVGGTLGLEQTHVFPEWLAAGVLRAEHVDVEDGERGLSVGPLLRLVGGGEPPLVGAVPEVEAELRLGDVAYHRLAGRAGLERSAGPLRIGALLDLVITGGDAPLDVRPTLGDGHAIPGFEWGEVRGRSRLVAGIDAAAPLLLDGYLRLRLRAGAAPDDAGSLDDLDGWTAGTALEGVWGTPLGRLLVGYGLNTRGDHRAEVSLGSTF